MDALDVSRWQFGITTVYHFIFVPLTIGLAPLIAVMQTAWVVTGQRQLVPTDAVLRQAVPDQLRDRRGDRHRAGIPVRHELERILALRRRHLRRTAGVRGPGRVLRRVHLHRIVDLRLDATAQDDSPVLHLDGRLRGQRVGVLHHRGQLVHAASGRRQVQPGERPGRAHRLRCPADATTLRSGRSCMSSPDLCSPRAPLSRPSAPG